MTPFGSRLSTSSLRRKIAGDRGDLERATEPRQFIAMQKVRRHSFGAKHLVRVDRWRRLRLSLSNKDEFRKAFKFECLSN